MQVRCEYMGCGVDAAFAWALRDTAKFLRAIKYNWETDERGGETVQSSCGLCRASLRDDCAGQVLDDYSPYLLTSFLDELMASDNAEAYYDIMEGEAVELGYHTAYIE